VVTWDVIRVTGLVVATAHPRAADFFAGSHLFWLGVLVGLVVAILIARMLINAVVFVAALAGLGAFHLVRHHGHVSFSGIGPWLVVALAAATVGLLLGRGRTLGHLGAAEFQTRLANIKKVSKWGW
jgi:L-cystine uptake protein TcyP (sodium:dicarboxylate symporter family)